MLSLTTILAIGIPLVSLAPFAVMAAKGARAKSGKRRAAQAMPQLAARLGLGFEASRDFDEVGEIEGTYRGYEVSLRPDFFGSMRVTPRGRYGIDLDTNQPTQRPESGMSEFVLGKPAFEKFFAQRYAAPEVIQALHAAPGLVDQLVALCTKYDAQLGHLKVDEYGVVAFVEEHHAYDTELIGGLVDDLVDLTATLDQALAACHKQDEW